MSPSLAMDGWIVVPGWLASSGKQQDAGSSRSSERSTTDSLVWLAGWLASSRQIVVVVKVVVVVEADRPTVLRLEEGAAAAGPY